MRGPVGHLVAAISSTISLVGEFSILELHANNARAPVTRRAPAHFAPPISRRGGGLGGGVIQSAVAFGLASRVVTSSVSSPQ